MSAGRPREFDEEAVLETAMQLFWAQGFEATSKRDLMEATGVASQSLYNAFGDKRSLYLAAIRHYADTRTSKLGRALEREGSPLAHVRAALSDLRSVPKNCETQQGCLLCNTLAEFGDHDEEIAGFLRRELKRMQQIFADALERGRERGEVAAGTDVESIAAAIVSAINGIALMRRAGVPKRMQEQAVDGVLTLLDSAAA